MNKIYKVIWSKVRNCYVAVSEIAKRNGKSCTSVNCGAKVNRGHVGVALSAAVGATLLAGVCSVLLPVRVALAAPVMPTLDVGGKSAAVSIASTSSATSATMNISSTQTNNVLKWIDFSIEQGGTVQFDPNNYLNYVTGHGRSEIDGILKQTKNSGGQRGSIYIVNPNGILFGDNARVDVGSLYVSTRKFTDNQLASLTYSSGTSALFKNDSAAVGDVINLGKLNADVIQVEGKNISFKNIADVTKGGTLTNGDITGGTPHYQLTDGSVTLAVNNVEEDPDNDVKENKGEIHLGFAVGVDGTINGSAAVDLEHSQDQYKDVTPPSLDGWTTTGTTHKYMLVRNPYELQNMQHNLTKENGAYMPGNYMLANDINFKNADDEWVIEHFRPVGSYASAGGPDNRIFQGRFDGLNYAINNIKIDSNENALDAKQSNIGIIGSNAGTIENLRVVDATVDASNIVHNNYLSNAVGGIVGANKANGIIRNVSFSGTVKGGSAVGGIAGYQNSAKGSYPAGRIEKAYNTGTIEAVYKSGYSNSESSGSTVGGIVGDNGGVVSEVYNSGKVSGDGTGNGNNKNVGGIAGFSGYTSSISNAYNTGEVSGKKQVGGIAGVLDATMFSGGTINNTYNSGPITIINDSSYYGGIVGYKYDTATVSNSYFSNGNDNGYGTQISDASKLKEFDTFAGSNLEADNRWDMSKTGGAGTVWRIYEGQTTPLLTAFLKTKDYIDKKTYDGTANVGTTKSVDSEQKPVTTHQGLAEGFDYVQDVSVIEPKELIVTFADISKTYDGTTADLVASRAGTLEGVIEADEAYVSVTASAAYDEKNAGNRTVNYTGVTLSGTQAGNYSIADTATGAGTITPKTLSLVNVSKVYDGTAVVVNDNINITSTDVIAGDSDSITFDRSKVSGTYADKNAGEGKVVNYIANDGALIGAAAGNYIISTAGTGDITKADLTLTAEDVTKTYDGTTEVTGGTLKVHSGTLFTGDSISGGNFVFADKNAGEGNKTVYVSNATVTDGNSGGNYNISYAANTTSTIMTKTLSVGNVTKEYDGNATASLTVSNLLGVEECDETGLSISAGVVANYTNNTGDKDANAGTGKRVEYTGLTLSGAEAGNYTIDASGTSTTGNSITARPLTMGSVSKVYDGTDNALVSVYALTNAIEDDLLDLSFKGTSSGKYSGKNVGDNLTVTYTGLILEGAKAGNYTIDSDAVVTGNSITPKELTLVADKVSIKSGESIPSSFTGDVIGFVEGEGLVSLDDLKFELATPGATMAGSYAIVGKLKSASGDYLANGVYSTDNTPPNYTFSNAPANEKAFTIAVDVMPQLDFRGASADVTIDSTTIANTMAISSIKSNNVLKWIDFSIGSGGTVQFDAKNYLNYVTGHGRSEINGTLKGGGHIYLINPNGMLFGSDAQVDVGNLYLSTRSFDVDALNVFDNNNTEPMNPLGSTATAAAGDIANLGTLTAANVMVEGNNVSFKNYADVIANNINVRASGEVHVGFATEATAATAINSTEYKPNTFDEPELTNWNFKGLDNETSVTPIKYMLVRNAYELQNINNNLTGNYMLANDIDFIDENGNWTIRYFKSLGSKGNYWGSQPGMFQGRLDGLNHVIRNINITNNNNESYSTDVGIIGSNAGIVENFGVVNGNIVLSSKSWVGGIVGANKGCGIIRNVYFSGLVEGNRNVGGIAGAQDGYNTQPGVPLPGGIIEKAYVSGTVRSNSSNGGSNVGGIVGSNANGARVSEAYNSANVSTKAGGNYIGGIAGTNNGTIINAYNTGTIEGGTYVGGIAGSNSSNGSIQNTYNIGTVSGTSNEGGIVGYNSGNSVVSSFFTVGNDNGNGNSLISDESKLKKFDTFAGSSLAASTRWDMSKTGGAGKVWRIYEGQTGPLLTAFLKTKDVVTATDYNGSEQTFDNTLAQGAANHIYATESGNLVKGTDARKYFGNNTDNNNSGYKVYYSDQGGYDIGDTILVIQPKKLTVGNVTKVYDGTADAAEAFTLDNLDVVAADKTETGLTLAVTSAMYNDKNADVNKTITYTGITLGGTRADNYVIHSNTIGTGTIEKKLITANFAAISKTYDGTTNDVDGGAVVASRIQAATVSDGVVAADEGKVNVAGVAAYDEKNAGTRTVNYTSVELSGDEASNYSVAETATGSGTINKAKVTLTVEDVTKTYDGTTAVTGKTLMVKPGSGTTIFASDSLSGGTFAFTDKNVGTGNKTVTVAGGTITDTTSGADTSGNYIITYENNTKSTITQAPITLSVADGYSRAYNGTADASGATTTVTSGEVFTGDSILSITKEYSDKNVGTGKTITISNAVIGDGAGNNSNYDISYVTNTGAITQAPITLSVADGYSRAYNGTADASGATTTVTSGEVFTGDSILSITKEYSDKNVGTGKTITVSNAVIGDGAGNNSNYDISYADGSGQVTTANLTLTAEDVTKIYDGTTDVAAADGKLKIVSGQLFGTDKMSGGTFAFTNKNAGTGNKVVTITDATISDGNSGGNYNVTYADNTTSTINKADLTLTAEDVVKTYDGTTVVTGGTLKVLSGTLFTGDSIGGGTFAFTDKNAGTGNKIVTVTDATISDGNGGENYNVTYANNTTSTINKKALTATFADISKTYDGTTNATPGAGTLTGVVAVDAGKVSVSASAAYDEKNAGNRTVNYTGVTLSGAEAGNYSIATTATGNGTIGRKALELVADPANTEYGDYNPASFTGRVDGFVTGESVSNGDTLLFALSDPSASAVGSYGITGTINGSSSGDYGLNYTFTNAASNANAFTIYARPASVQDMVLSDIIPGIKGKSGADISVTALDNAMEQARDKRAEVGIEFAVAQTILSVDADRNLSLENRGMKQPPAMTPQEVAEQVHAQQGNGNGVAAQAGGNAGAASAGANENGAASNAGVAGAVNAAMDVVQQTDNAVGTEESKRKKGVA